jgi:hypothetical protein
MKTYQYTESELHHYLGQVCETDRQKLKYRVIQDLQFFCNLSESEAATIWDEAIQQRVLTLYTPWEQDDRFKTYSYDGLFTGEKPLIDATDKGMGATYHNNKESIVPKSGRYGSDRINKKGSFSRLQTRKPQ